MAPGPLPIAGTSGIRSLLCGLSGSGQALHARNGQRKESPFPCTKTETGRAVGLSCSVLSDAGSMHEVLSPPAAAAAKPKKPRPGHGGTAKH